MQNDTLYFLKISGTVQSGKEREFQQTVMFIFNHLPASCISRNLAVDVDQSNLYHIYSLWRSRRALLSFRSSNEFELLKGAFEALGAYREGLEGVQTDVDLFEVKDVLKNLRMARSSSPRASLMAQTPRSALRTRMRALRTNTTTNPNLTNKL